MQNGSNRVRRLATALFTTIVCLVAAPLAGAELTATVTPNQPGKATRIHWSVDGMASPINGLIPRSLTVSAPRGFVLNTNAAAKRCKPVLAALNECPKTSQIGSATLTIRVLKPSGPRDLPVPVNLFLGPKNSLLAVAFLAGVRVVPGSISGSNGITVTFNPLPTPPVIKQVSYQFIGVTVDLGGVTRKITHRVRVKSKKGHRRHKKYRTRVVRRIHLVQTPSNCGASTWGLTASLGLPDGTTANLSFPVVC
jgi:hypothetical protein